MTTVNVEEEKEDEETEQLLASLNKNVSLIIIFILLLSFTNLNSLWVYYELLKRFCMILLKKWYFRIESNCKGKGYVNQFFFKECTFRGKRICIFRGKKKKCPANFYRLKVWYHESFIFSDTRSRSPVGASFENFQPVGRNQSDVDGK